MRRLLIGMVIAAAGCVETETSGPAFSGTTHWKQQLHNGYCYARAEPSALGCRVRYGIDTEEPTDGGEVLMTAADGAVDARCGETVDTCGHPYRCECEKCDDATDYASRMSHGRHEEIDPPRDHDIVLFSVHYDGGKCEGVADPHYGDAKRCMVSAWDDSTVGGCHRHTTEPGTGEFSCGQSAEVCGIRVRCDCPAAGVQRLTIARH